MNKRQSAAIRILTVDDHPLVREGIAAVLEAQPDMKLVGEASTGREAILLFREHKPDVTLMDLRMPDMNGLETIAKIRAEFADARIIDSRGGHGGLEAMRLSYCPHREVATVTMTGYSQPAVIDGRRLFNCIDT